VMLRVLVRGIRMSPPMPICLQQLLQYVGGGRHRVTVRPWHEGEAAGRQQPD
jgi:hypothetical protein